MIAPLIQSDYPGRWWIMLPDGRIECRLCPRFCKLNEGQRGFCFVRQRVDDRIVLTTYGRSSGFCVDPIEKKPLNHFLPGTDILSFGTAGCNLGCRFCQNWDISKARLDEHASAAVTPEQVVALAKEYRCPSLAYTYNDPVIWAEFVVDIARETSPSRWASSTSTSATCTTPRARRRSAPAATRSSSSATGTRSPATGFRGTAAPTAVRRSPDTSSRADAPRPATGEPCCASS